MFDQETRNYKYLKWYKRFYSEKFTIIKLDRINRWEQFVNELYEFHEHPVNVSRGLIVDSARYIDGYEDFHLDNTVFYENLTEENVSNAFGLPNSYMKIIWTV